MKFGNTREFPVVPVVDTNAYSANDNVGGLLTLKGFGTTFGRGVLKNVTVSDLDNQKAALTIVFFSKLPAATFTNNAAFPNLSAADLALVLGKVEIAATDYTTLNARAVATKECSTCLNSAPESVTSTNVDRREVYAAIMTSGTPTYTTVSSLTLQFGTLLD